MCRCLGRRPRCAPALLVTLASCDVEDGEAEIAAWLAVREPGSRGELIDAAARGSPGLRGAAFAVLDRIGADAVPPSGGAGRPLLHAHAAVWLNEHGEEAHLDPADRAWLLVDLGAGLLEEADPRTSSPSCFRMSRPDQAEWSPGSGKSAIRA